MKQLSIEEKAKRYDEALEKARCYYWGANGNEDMIIMTTTMFPELKESEDEVIRKDIISYLKSSTAISPKTWITWLEKQGDANKEYWRGYREGKQEILDKYAELEKHGEQHIVDKVESKFKVGDWIIDIQGVAFNRIINSDGESYQIETCCSNFWLPIHITEKNYRSWTIQDAKCGDILVDDLGNICIYQEPSTKLMFHSFCYGNHKCFIDGGGSHKIVGTCPATKEQRYLLFQKMKEAGYDWDTEKKELKKVEKKPNLDVEIPFGTDSELVEETITIPDGCYAIIEDNKVILRKGEKKSSWSEEDERIKNNLLSELTNLSVRKLIEKETEKKYASWLKSLRPQSFWKPSDEQMKALSIVTCGVDDPLFSLYQDLKKLREE